MLVKRVAEDMYLSQKLEIPLRSSILSIIYGDTSLKYVCTYTTIQASLTHQTQMLIQIKDTVGDYTCF